MIVIGMQTGPNVRPVDTFKRFFEYKNADIIEPQVSSELIGEEAHASWGKIHVDHKYSTGWFNDPIEWYRTANTLAERFISSPAKGHVA
jgi:hypothetical protein